MSEYQHYDFVAIDRPLTAREMSELRALSTRASITPTSFTNEYQWGDFKGNPDKLMELYFDAYCYVANWGTREVQLRFPKQVFTRETVKPYLLEERLEFRQKGDYAILTLRADDEEGYWELNRDPDEWLPGLTPLREDLVNGDLRALYLAWLAAAQDGFVDEDTLEPPVPPGLAELPPPLRMLAELLMLDEDLIEAAAEASGSALVAAQASKEGFSAWLSGLPEHEKTALLLRVALEDNRSVGRELRRRHREATEGMAPGRSPSAPTRTAGALLLRAEAIGKEKKKRAAARAAAARKKHLDDLASREESAWREIERVFAMPGHSSAKSAAYQEKAQVLRDLRELADGEGRREAFDARVATLRTKYGRKASFWQRFDETRRW